MKYEIEIDDMDLAEKIEDLGGFSNYFKLLNKLEKVLTNNNIFASANPSLDLISKKHYNYKEDEYINEDEIEFDESLINFKDIHFCINELTRIVNELITLVPKELLSSKISTTGQILIREGDIITSLWYYIELLNIITGNTIYPTGNPSIFLEKAVYLSRYNTRKVEEYFKDPNIKEDIDEMFSSKLTPFEEQVLRLFYGFDGIQMDFLQMAEHFGKPTDYIRAVSAKALRKIKHPGTKSKYKHLLYN